MAKFGLTALVTLVMLHYTAIADDDFKRDNHEHEDIHVRIDNLISDLSFKLSELTNKIETLHNEVPVEVADKSQLLCRQKLREQHTEVVRQSLFKFTAEMEVLYLRKQLKNEEILRMKLVEELEKKRTEYRELEGALRNSTRQRFIVERDCSNRINVIKSNLDNKANKVSELEKKLQDQKQCPDVEKVNNKPNKIRESEEETDESITSVSVESSVDYTALQQAARDCNHSEAKKLLDDGASPSSLTEKNENETQTTSIHLAVKAGCTYLVDVFTRDKNMLNVRNANGATPLHDAAYYSKKDIIQLLLDRGADVNACDAYNNTPLHYAADYASPEVMKLLIDQGANVEAVNENGQNPAVYAAFWERKDNAEWLEDNY